MSALPLPENAAVKRAELEAVLRSMNSVAVAVSGGIDSLTLAACAHGVLGARASMFHAVSPAVPGEATQRTRELADREGWDLTVFDAGEFGSGEYLRNPLNRCYFCKTSLYAAIRPRTAATIVSGTNLDDLGEYRPGLIAAQEVGVRHPFVEAAIDKRTVRAVARLVSLGELADLPASPCLSSRVETGIAIDAAVLRSIHAVESLVQRALSPRIVRCRVRSGGVVIELDPATLAGLVEAERRQLRDRVAALFPVSPSVSFAPYRIGSAFLHPIKVVG